MRIFIIAVLGLSISLSEASISFADCSQHTSDVQQQSGSDDSGEFAAVVRTLEKDGKIHDCTMYASGENCVLIGIAESVPAEPQIAE